jgi:hypothetical protein
MCLNRTLKAAGNVKRRLICHKRVSANDCTQKKIADYVEIEKKLLYLWEDNH